MAKTTLAKKLKNKVKAKPKLEPVWKGPEEDGITQSLLGRFLVCRERFRIMTIEGLRVVEGFNHRLEYGNMWHICEEYVDGDWQRQLKDYATNLARTYPAQSEDVNRWWRVCQMQFPIYVKYWSKHPDMAKRKAIYAEETFCESYELANGRIVKLRGKWDSVDMVGKSVVLQENKSKGDINEQGIQQQLLFDLQTMFYLTALRLRMRRSENFGDRTNHVRSKIGGVRYNVVRRPLSGGKGTIRPHQATKSKPAETMDEFYGRLQGIIEDDPGYFFMRWDVAVTDADIDRFEQRFLQPVLQQLCLWYDFITGPETWHEGQMVHWQHPYGVWNAMNEGRSSELDEYLNTGSELGLERVTNLFRELDDADD